MSYKIIGDSAMDLTQHMLEDKEHFGIVPIILQLGDKHYLDDENFDQKSFLKLISECHECPRTACPSPEEYCKAYECKADDVYVVCITEKLSGSYNAACIGKTVYEEKHGEDGKNIAIFNSLSGTAGMTSIGLFIEDLCKNGLPFDEIVRLTEKYIEKLQTFFVLGNLEFLRKNGRLSGTAALFATALNIKPILFAHEGEIKKFDTARGQNKALKKMCEAAVKRAIEANNGLKALKRAVIVHCNCLDRAQLVESELRALADFEEIVIADTRGVATLYAADGGVIVGI
ncbi:MAG: DegV family protein [Eubacteriales bacterium]|nr:DegV family protein [Eubacteriales bacterium]